MNKQHGTELLVAKLSQGNVDGSAERSGKKMDSFRLFDELLHAESEDEVEGILKKAGYLNDDPTIWKPCQVPEIMNTTTG